MSLPKLVLDDKNKNIYKMAASFEDFLGNGKSGHMKSAISDDQHTSDGFGRSPLR